jgi:hypothetical protein
LLANHLIVTSGETGRENVQEIFQENAEKVVELEKSLRWIDEVSADLVLGKIGCHQEV